MKIFLKLCCRSFFLGVLSLFVAYVPSSCDAGLAPGLTCCYLQAVMVKSSITPFAPTLQNVATNSCNESELYFVEGEYTQYQICNIIPIVHTHILKVTPQITTFTATCCNGQGGVAAILNSITLISTLPSFLTSHSYPTTIVIYGQINSNDYSSSILVDYTCSLQTETNLAEFIIASGPVPQATSPSVTQQGLSSDGMVVYSRSKHQEFSPVDLLCLRNKIHFAPPARGQNVIDHYEIYDCSKHLAKPQLIGKIRNKFKKHYSFKQSIDTASRPYKYKIYSVTAAGTYSKPAVAKIGVWP